MFHPPNNRRERILLFGPWSSGKSSAWLNVAQWIKKTGGDSKLYVVDTDRAWEAMDPGGLENVVFVYDAQSFPEMKEAAREIHAKATRDDWFVFDVVDRLWAKAQEDYFENLTDGDFDEFLTESRKQGENIGGEWGANWGIINKKYNMVAEKLFGFRGHVLACTHETEVRQPKRDGTGGDSERIRATYTRLGVRPAGQKDLGGIFHTVLYMQERKLGEEWVMTTAKDRGPVGESKREYLRGVGVGQFAMDYLMKVCGWRP